MYKISQIKAAYVMAKLSSNILNMYTSHRAKISSSPDVSNRNHEKNMHVHYHMAQKHIITILGTSRCVTNASQNMHITDCYYVKIELT